MNFRYPVFAILFTALLVMLFVCVAYPTKTFGVVLVLTALATISAAIFEKDKRFRKHP